eukprot:195469_1
MSNKAESIKINNRKAAHSQHAHVLKQKRHGSGKGGWGDPMDDLKYLNQDPAKNPEDPNFEPEQITEVTQSTDLDETQTETRFNESAQYFQNFQSDVESLSAFKIKVEELVNEYLYDKDEEKFTASLNDLNCPNFFNQVPKVLLWTVVASKKQEHFPATRKLLMHFRSTNTISKIQLESAFRRLFHRLNELSMMNQNAYIILVDFGEYCVARNLMEDEFLTQLKKQTQFAKDPQRIERLKKHVQDIIAEFFSSGDIDEAIRCVAEMDTPFYNHEVVKRIISTAFDHTNRERELTSQFLARAVGDNIYNENDTNYAIPRKNCELGFIILLQRVEGLYKDVPDVLELLSAFVGRAIVDEVLPPAFIDNVDLLETDMGYAVIKHVQHLLSGPRHSDPLLNVWGTNSSKSIQSMKTAIANIIKEYLISRELDEALTAIQELNIAMFHHEIIKQLIPAVADYYVAKDLLQQNGTNTEDDAAGLKIKDALNIPPEIADKAIQIQLAIDLISTALQHNIMATQQVRGGFIRLRERLDDYKLDSPLIAKYYDCVLSQFGHIMVAVEEEKQVEAVTTYGGAKEKEIDDQIEAIVTQSKPLVMEYTKQGKEWKTYDAIQCKTQCVAGIHYLLKVRINDGQCIHVFIWRKLDESIQLLGVDLNKTEEDLLVFTNEEKEKRKVVVGGLKDKAIDELVVRACQSIKEGVAVQAQQEKQKVFTEFTPIKAKSQVVAGTNLFVKVKVDQDRFIHIRVWCKLDSTCELSSVQWDKNESDQITYF